MGMIAIVPPSAPAADLHAEAVVSALQPRSWTFRPGAIPPRGHALLLTAGAGRISGSEEASLAAPCLAWMPAGAERSLLLEAGSAGHLLSVSAAFLGRTLAELAEGLLMRRTVEGFLLVGIPSLALPVMVQALEAIAREARDPGRGAGAVLRAHLTLLLVEMWRLAAQAGKEPGDAATGAAGALLQQFSHLVELHYRAHWPVERYAATLCVTTDRLHAACVRDAGKAPRALIHERLAAEARVRLEQLDLSVEQIGFGLGFRDAGYFNRFFRRHVGMPPGAYRHRARLRRQRPVGESFAAWP
jgi:AraC family transcriptional activator of pobA